MATNSPPAEIRQVRDCAAVFAVAQRLADRSEQRLEQARRDHQEAMNELRARRNQLLQAAPISEVGAPRVIELETEYVVVRLIAHPAVGEGPVATTTVTVPWASVVPRAIGTDREITL